MRLDLLFHGLDLGVEGGQDRDLGADGGRVGGGDDGGLAQVLGAQRGLDPRGLGGDVAAAGPFERRADLVERQLAADAGSGAMASSSSASGASGRRRRPARPGRTPAARAAAAACGGCVPRSASCVPG